jgi:hypothetical protein
MLAVMVVMLRGLEQLVPDAIVRLEHACSLAGQLDPACSTRVSFDSSSMPGAIVGGSAPTPAQDRGANPAAGGWCLRHHHDLASSPFNKNNG